jgi:hypothetical protein
MAEVFGSIIDCMICLSYPEFYCNTMISYYDKSLQGLISYIDKLCGLVMV